MAKGIPDEAVVVRGGLNRAIDIVRSTGTHPCGVVGVSVESSADVGVLELSRTLPHGKIGVTTVRRVRAAGGDVVRTAGKSTYHATLTGLSPEVTSTLLTPTIVNPAKDEQQSHG